MVFLSVATFLIGYLFGSLPTGYVTAKLRGVDIRQHGSGNIGATNVLRVLGKPWGVGVFFVDALKGFLAVRITLALVGRHPGTSSYTDYFAILAAASCVFGHSFPVWLGFKGGKGVATSVGSIFGVAPIAAVTIFMVWLIVLLITGYVSLASVIGALALPVSLAVLLFLKMNTSPVLLYFSIPMTALVVWRHRSNMVRLFNGAEPRIARK